MRYIYWIKIYLINNISMDIQKDFLLPENNYSIVIKTIVGNALNKLSQLKLNPEIDNILIIIKLVSTIVYSSVNDGNDFNLNPYAIAFITSLLLVQILNLPESSGTEIIVDVQTYYSLIINNAIANIDAITQNINLIYSSVIVNSGVIPNINGSESIKIAENYSRSRNSIYIIASNSTLDLVKKNPSLNINSLIELCINHLFSMGCNAGVTAAIVGTSISLLRNNIGNRVSIKENEYLGLISGCALNSQELNYVKTTFIVKEINKTIQENGKIISIIFILLTLCKIF